MWIITNVQKIDKFVDMKRLITVFILIISAFLSYAENYPYRSDALWVCVPDHGDWLYKTGEEASIDIQFFKYGIPRDGEIRYELSDDMMSSDRQGSIKLQNGKARLNIGSRNSPGFRDLKLSLTLDGSTYEHHVKVGFSPERIKPYTKLPDDFSAFWQEALNEMHKTPLSYSKELADEYCTDKIDCYLIKVKVDPRHSVYAYLFYPKNAREGSHPAVLCPPGAGIKTIKEPLKRRYYAESGCIRMEMEIHGLDPRISTEAFNQISEAFNSRENGYLANGIDDRNRYYMKTVYLALVRCLDLLASLPEWDGRNLAVQGGSQGGGLAIVAAGLDKRVTHCIVNHPALADMAAYAEKGRTGGYPHFNRIPGILSPEAIRTLSYYDVVNFARYVSAKVHMTWGFNDNTCPPTTSYAVWNTLDCDKESLITPINEHWTSEATERGQLQWLLNNLIHNQ